MVLQMGLVRSIDGFFGIGTFQVFFAGFGLGDGLFM